MSPIAWAMRPLSKYATFSGRAPRPEYWWFYLLYVIVYVVAGIIGSLVGVGVQMRLLAAVAFFLPLLAAGVRRLHDTDRSGWWMLAPLLPITIAMIMMGPAILTGVTGSGMGIAGLVMAVGVIMAIVVLVFLVLPGTVGDNRFGPDPHCGQPIAA